MKKAIALATIATLFLTSAIFASTPKHISKKIDAEGAERLVIEADLAAGEFTISARDMEEAAVVEIDYNPRHVDNEISYDVSRNTGYLALESSLRRRNRLDIDDNLWDIVLSKRYPTTLSMEIGASDADIDLGGVPIEELIIEFGAASGVLEFSSVNPIRLKEITIEAGVSSLDMISIGNANFDEFRFEGGIGSFDLDFRGEYKGESRIEIEIGLGSADIILPRGIPVRIETENDNWLSSIDIHNRDLDIFDDGIYESDDFEDADTRIVLILEVGLGSVDVFWK